MIGVAGARAASNGPGDERLSRNVGMYYIYKIAQNLQFWMSVSILYLQWRGLSLGEIGLLETVGGLVVMLCEIPTGAIADLFGRRLSIALGMFLRGAGLAVYGLAHSFWFVALSYIPWMIGYTMTSGADSALLYDSLKAIGREGDYARIEGRAMTLASGGAAVAGISGAFLASQWSYQAPIWLTLVASAFGGFVALGFREPPRQNGRAGGRVRLSDQFRAAAGVLAGQSALFYLMLFGALTSGVSFVLSQSYAQVYARAAGLPVGLFGLLAFALVGGGMIGSSLSGRLIARVGEHRALLVIPSLMGLAFLGMAAQRSLPGLALLPVVPFLSSVLRPALMAGVNREISSNVRATVLSTQSLLWALVLSVLSPVVGNIADRSAGAAFLAMALTLLGSAALLRALARGKRWTDAAPTNANKGYRSNSL